MQSLANKATPLPTNVKVPAQANAFASATRVVAKPGMIPATKLPYTVARNRDFVIMSASSSESFLGGNKPHETGISSMSTHANTLYMQPQNLQGTGPSDNKYTTAGLSSSGAGYMAASSNKVSNL